MTQPPRDGPRVLLTNDDGIDAPGLRLLESVARGLSGDVWVVAPAAEQSGTAHSISLTQPIRVRRLDDQRFSVSGTPADCVVMACKLLMRERPPALVLSGINRGPNLGDDCIYSGTTGAAREAALCGVRAVALSQGLTGDEVRHWETAERYAPAVLERLLAIEPPPGVFYNVNFPDVEPGRVRGLRVVPHGDRWNTELSVRSGRDGRGVPYYWLALDLDPREFPAGTDLAAVAEGCIAVSPLQLKVNHEPGRKRLQEHLAGLSDAIARGAAPGARG